MLTEIPRLLCNTRRAGSETQDGEEMEVEMNYGRRPGLPQLHVRFGPRLIGTWFN